MSKETTSLTELILESATIYCPVGGFFENACIQIVGDRIEFIGAHESLPRTSRKKRVINLKGKLVLPGFQDAHLHPLIGSIDLIECNLNGLKTVDEYLEKIAKYYNEHPTKEYIRGSGWLYSCFGEKGPNRELLDKIVPDKPVFLKAFDGHAAWVNSIALQRYGINRYTPDPVGGRIERDPKTGEPTGVLREWPAMGLINSNFPKPKKEDYLSAARVFIKQAAAYGITGIHEAQGKDPFPEIYLELEKLGELTFRVTASRLCDSKLGPEQIDEMKLVREKYRTKLFKYGPAKVFVDGVVEGETALLLRDYSDNKGHRGNSPWDFDKFKEITFALSKNGFPLHAHAVGDAAIRFVLDAIEWANSQGADLKKPHQIAHCDLISKADMPRMARLKVIANVQPAWFYKDSNFYRITLPALGKSRCARLYPLKSMLNFKVPIACSSDWPFGGDFSTFNPLDSIRIGATRIGITSSNSKAFIPSECVSVRDLVNGYTLGAASACFRDEETGSIEIGKKADLVVLNENIFKIAPHEVNKVSVFMTIFDGRIVYSMN